MPVITGGRSGLASGSSGGVVVPRSTGGIYVPQRTFQPSRLLPPIGLFGNAGGAYYDLIVSDGPVSYWRVDESTGLVAIDSVGRNHGAYKFGPTFRQTGAIVGDPDGALFLDGISEYVSIPDDNTLDLGDGPLSVEIWFQRTGNFATNYDYILSKGNQFGLEFDSTDVLIFDQDGSVQTTSTTTFPTADGLWHHVVGVHDSGAVKHNCLYIDGVEEGIVISDSLFGSNTVAVAIGAYWDGTNPHAGGVDEIAVYGYALTAGQVAAHYAAAGYAIAGASSGYPYVGGGYYP